MTEEPREREVYLDYNATTPIDPEVREAMMPFLTSQFGNPSSSHRAGRIAREAVEKARGEVARFVGARPNEIVFTGGGTEACNLAIIGASRARPNRTHYVTSEMEHPAVSEPLAFLERMGSEVFRARIDDNGRVIPKTIQNAIDERTNLVSLMHAHNETGVIQSVEDVVSAAHAASAWVHTDASQSIGKVRVDVKRLGVDLLTIAGHKLYAPKGIGALFVRDGVSIAPCLMGAGHEGGLRPGTENVAGIVALGAACVRAERDLDQEGKRVSRLRNALFHAIQAEVLGVFAFGSGVDRLPNTLYMGFSGLSGAELLRAAPQVLAGTGSACHDGHDGASAVVLAMGYSRDLARGAVRLTLGRGTTEDDVAFAARELAKAANELRARHPPGDR
jgi:cysteine desulfurase